MDLGGLDLGFRIAVAEHLAQDAVRFVPGLAQHLAVGDAHVLAPALPFAHGFLAEFLFVHFQFGGGGLPTETVGAVLGGQEEGVVEEVDVVGGDHGSVSHGEM